MPAKNATLSGKHFNVGASSLHRGLAQGSDGVDGFANQRRAFVDEARVDLHQAGTRGNDRQAPSQFRRQHHPEPRRR